MLETSLLGVNYNKKGKEIALAKSAIKNRFFINLLAISSTPFAIIIVAGKIINKSSIPFFEAPIVQTRPQQIYLELKEASFF